MEVSIEDRDETEIKMIRKVMVRVQVYSDFLDLEETKTMMRLIKKEVMTTSLINQVVVAIELLKHLVGCLVF